jgi:hypothetical protein
LRIRHKKTAGNNPTVSGFSKEEEEKRKTCGKSLNCLLRRIKSY